jgi:hypothetical protein
LVKRVRPSRRRRRVSCHDHVDDLGLLARRTEDRADLVDAAGELAALGIEPFG